MNPEIWAERLRTVDLRATEGYISTPDGNSICFWGYASGAGAPPQLPGPTLVVTQGDVVIVNLTNELPEPVSIRFPGQEAVTYLRAGAWEPVRPHYAGGRLVSLVPAAQPGQTVTYRFVAARPGTYIYESGAEPHKQVPMGLHGALVIRPAGYDPVFSRNAYGFATGTRFDREYLLVLGEIDPDLHLAVQRGQPYRVSARRPRYWTLNGRCAPDTMLPDRVPYLPHQPYGAMIKAEPGERILLRLVGAGLDTHPIHPHGNHGRVVARDGRLLRNGWRDLSHRRFTVMVGAGETCDVIIRWTGLEFTPSNPIPTTVPGLQNLVVGPFGWTSWSGSPYLGGKGHMPVGIVTYNENGEYCFPIHVHQEFEVTNWGEFPGGMMTMMAIYPRGTLGPGVGVLS